jgi:hypothetical protein
MLLAGAIGEPHIHRAGRSAELGQEVHPQEDTTMTQLTTLKTRAGWAIRLLASAAAVMAAAAPASAHSNHPDFAWLLNARLQGTWRVEVTTYNCSTLLEGKPFISFLAFGADGSLIETTSNPAFLPGQRSGGFGYWERTGRNFYHMVSEAFIQFGSDARGPIPAFKRGTQKLDGGLEMTGRDAFSVDSTVTFFDEAGAVVMAGCAKAVGTRFE